MTSIMKSIAKRCANGKFFILHFSFFIFIRTFANEMSASLLTKKIKNYDYDYCCRG